MIMTMMMIFIIIITLSLLHNSNYGLLFFFLPHLDICAISTQVHIYCYLNIKQCQVFNLQGALNGFYV